MNHKILKGKTDVLVSINCKPQTKNYKLLSVNLF